ncbi:MAG: peptidoglycan bridge formation glycyltransferase FemA/FemB family protein [Marinifilum sp.]|jgi:lipid II:glycine glycyltransferase (peptidoglycan interpeptide bridge formation enzyme)|nr:peptidoglycan bridge formation glycyltransferase FemA/FemB family protein [Marinifilum sp.]
MEVIHHPDKIDRIKWEEFIQYHPNGNVFQTPQMYDVYKETPKYYPVFLAVKNESEILGTLLAVILKVHDGLLGKFSSRAIIMGGPIVKDEDEEVTELLLNSYNSMVRNKAIYTQIRNMWDTSKTKSAFHLTKFKYVEHLNILVDLEKKEEDLWKEVEKRKRNRIRKAQKEGIEISVDNSDEAIENVYGVLNDVFKRVKLPLPDLIYFKNLRKKLIGNPSLLIFVAKHQGKIIGCSISLKYKGVIYDYYAGSYCSEYAKCPNDLIPWKIFLWGKTNDCKVFDFGGAGKPNVSYGVRDYKKKYGGKIVNLGRYEKVHQPLMYAFAKKAFMIWQKLQN